MEKKVNISTILYLIAWELMALYLLLFESTKLSVYGTIELKNFVSLFCITLLFIKVIFFDKYNIKTIIGMIALIILCNVLYNHSHSEHIMRFALFFLTAKNVEFKKVVKCDLIIRIACIILIFIYLKIGFLESTNKLINGALKHSLGWCHSNVFALNAIIALVEYLYIFYKNKKLTIINIFIIILVVSFLFYYAASRTALYTLFAVLIFGFIIKKYKKILDFKIIRYSIILIFPLLILLSVSLVSLYKANTDIGIKINQVMTGRLKLADRAITKEGISIFGKYIDWIYSGEIQPGQLMYCVDMAYIKIFLENGLIWTILSCIAYIYLMKKLIDDNKIDEMLLVVFFLVIGLGENCILRFFFNFTLILLWKYIDKEENQISISGFIKDKLLLMFSNKGEEKNT